MLTLRAPRVGWWHLLSAASQGAEQSLTRLHQAKDGKSLKPWALAGTKVLAAAANTSCDR